MAILGGAVFGGGCLGDPDEDGEADVLDGDAERGELPEELGPDDTGMVGEEDSAADPDRDDSPSAGIVLPARGDGELTVTEGAEQASAPAENTRNILRCFATAANEAYNSKPADDIDCFGGTKLKLISSGKELTIWGLDSTTGQTLVLSFAGTHPTRMKDIWTDVKNIVPVRFNSQLRDVYYRGLTVGSGWLGRWKANVGRAKGEIDKAIERHRKAPAESLQIIVTGHSMGGAVATLAGYDIARYLVAQKLDSNRGVFVFAFNPANVGNGKFRDSYAAALLSPKANKLFYRQLLRHGDPVQVAPPRLHHPVWNTKDKRIGSGKYKARTLTYCPEYAAPRNGGIVKQVLTMMFANHVMTRWLTHDIGRINEATLLCLRGDA